LRRNFPGGEIVGEEGDTSARMTSRSSSHVPGVASAGKRPSRVGAIGVSTASWPNDTFIDILIAQSACPSSFARADELALT